MILKKIKPQEVKLILGLDLQNKKDTLLGIDIGSSGCKVTFLNISNFNFYTFSSYYKTLYPRVGWAEQDSKEWITTLKKIIKDKSSQYNFNLSQVIGIGLSGVTHSPVLLDKNNNVLGNVIHLTDNRSLQQSKELEKYNNFFLKKCFNTVSPMWTISMLKWIKDKHPEYLKNTKKIIFPKDYLRFKLTGDIYTDEIDAEGTLLFDPLKKCWIKDFIDLVGFNERILPSVFKPTDLISKVSDEGVSLFGFLKGTPVCVGTTDTLLEILAAGNAKEGECTVKLATFGRICVISNKPFCGDGIITYSYIIPGLWYPGTGTKSCGTSYNWLYEEFYKDLDSENPFENIDFQAENVEKGSKGLMFHPYLQGEGSPYNDSKLRGDFLGITLHHKREYFARAILEGTSFSLLDSLEFLKSNGLKINKTLKIIGGGSKSKVWVKILTDILGYNTAIPASTDASFGAAMLAGISLGVFTSIEDAIKKCCHNTLINNYDKKSHDFYKKLFKIYKKSKNSLTEIYHEISEIIN